MKAVIQRVSSASVTVNEQVISSVDKGLLVFVGIEHQDNDTDISRLSSKIINLRIFDDADKVPNLSLKDTGGEVLLVSQFTLHAETKKGNRPSYIKAAKPEIAMPLYEAFIKQLQMDLGKGIQTGRFGADMKVSLVNDGPLTILMDTRE